MSTIDNFIEELCYVSGASLEEKDGNLEYIGCQNDIFDDLGDLYNKGKEGEEEILGKYPGYEAEYYRMDYHSAADREEFKDVPLNDRSKILVVGALNTDKDFVAVEFGIEEVNITLCGPYDSRAEDGYYNWDELPEIDVDLVLFYYGSKYSPLEFILGALRGEAIYMHSFDISKYDRDQDILLDQYYGKLGFPEDYIPSPKFLEILQEFSTKRVGNIYLTSQEKIAEISEISEESKELKESKEESKELKESKEESKDEPELKEDEPEIEEEIPELREDESKDESKEEDLHISFDNELEDEDVKEIISYKGGETRKAVIENLNSVINAQYGTGNAGRIICEMIANKIFLGNDYEFKLGGKNIEYIIGSLK